MQARRRWPGYLAGAFLFAIVLFGSGLIAFVRSFERNEVSEPPTADGIVVLTGGPDRIEDAATLLSAGRSKRLLVTGVKVGVTPDTLAHQLPRFRTLFECCVDLGHEALNTTGNAREANAWARDHGYRSLVVVTSSWHMPRTLVEFRAALPDVRLTPYAVVSDRFAAGRWPDGQVARTVVIEYAKFLVAWVRTRTAALGA